MSKPLEKEFQFYLDHQVELVAKYNGRVVVIKGEEVIGVYDDEMESVTETRKSHALGTFLVQRCTPGSEAYTVKYHSRIAFPIV
ncbi:hypothetical protein HQ587_03455 [bacterium]|nr:hypothetical protein [bacterium]